MTDENSYTDRGRLSLTDEKRKIQKGDRERQIKRGRNNGAYMQIMANREREIVREREADWES